MRAPDLEIDTGNFASSQWVFCPPSSVNVVCWNINRGLQLPRVVEFLRHRQADILLLQEADLNARRTHHLHITREIAQKLQLNYVFGREFQELAQGTRHSPAYHGQATLSRWPLSNARIIRFEQQSTFWQPRWFLPEIEPFQERLGGRIALVVETCVAGKRIITYNLHLESRGDDWLRIAQLEETLQDAQQYNRDEAIIVAGDFNVDVSGSDAAQMMRSSNFQDVFAGEHVPTTPNSFFTEGRVIDWIFSRGPLRPGAAHVHRSVAGSDHYPLSATLDLR